VSSAEIVSTNPAAPDEVIWRGTPVPEQVDEAVAAARAAAPEWAATPLEERIMLLQRWQEVTTARAEEVAGLICDEMGKTMAEALFEAKALAGKVDVTLGEHSLRRVHEYEVAASGTRIGRCRYKPHGVMAVIGPFNFPAHLANGHFVPALLMGDTIVFKPSEKTPAVGQLLGEMMQEAGAPPGVFNVVHGAGDIATRLVSHDDIDGILFTGSWPVGRKILEANLDRPGRIVALEMGGNNPAVVLPDAPLPLAVVECARAAFATTGQRCTCTRRIIVHADVADTFIPALCKVASTLLVGPPRSPEPVFMGPLVTAEARQSVLDFQNEIVAQGGRALVECSEMDQPGHFLTAGVVEVDAFTADNDCEVFGPLVQVAIVNDFDEAITQANATDFGLAAAVFTNDDATFDRFFREIRAGCINRNTGTAGASSALPFGGLGRSGNHRPAAAFAVDYCAYPVAAMIEHAPEPAVPAGMHFEEAWIETERRRDGETK
jgi:succinylglutamic semialdehyde dehydrogenase